MGWAHWLHTQVYTILRKMVSLFAIAMLGCKSLGKRQIATSLLGKNPLSALVAFAIAAGWDQTQPAATSFVRRHFCGRALVRLCPQLAIAMSWQCQSVLFLPDKSLQVSVPEPWIDSLLPGVRIVLEQVQARNAWVQSGKRRADDTISDRAAEGFLYIALYVLWHLLLAEPAVQDTEVRAINMQPAK